MFVSRAKHQSEISSFVSQLEELRAQHATRVADLCRGYEMKIAALEDNIADLRRLVFSPTRPDFIPAEQQEADAIITQNEPNVQDADEAEEALRERDRIFAGSFDGDL